MCGHTEDVWMSFLFQSPHREGWATHRARFHTHVLGGGTTALQFRKQRTLKLAQLQHVGGDNAPGGLPDSIFKHQVYRGHGHAWLFSWG